MEQGKKFTITNFRELMKTNTRYHSEIFTIGNCNWELAVYRVEKEKKYLAIYLSAADASSLLPGWRIKAEFTLTVVNQSPSKKSKTKAIKHKFCEEKDRCGRSSFIPLEELKEKNSGFIRDNKCIVEVKFRVVEPAGLVYFKDLGRIKEPFVPLLKEVLPGLSLLDSKKNQTCERVFIRLGRVLKFLQEKKWKDMKDEKFRVELRNLWEKLSNSGLDLHWLKPNVKLALGIKGYKIKTKEERVKLKLKLEKLEKEKKDLEKEKKDLEKKLRRIEKSVEKTTDLKNANRFKKEKDLDKKIKYPNPKPLKS